MSNAIEVEGLVKRYGDKVVVDHVSMIVKPGQIAGFLGPNGSGKTTTIRMMCGLLTPDGGRGTVLGRDVMRESLAIKREVGYMTQKFSFYEDLSIEENLMFVARLYRLKPARAKVLETLEGLGLASRRGQLAGSLSGGWKQRLALAACIMHEPKLLLLDEPTAGVDPKARREFWDEIHRLAARGLTVLVSTHYMDEAERCHEIHYISYGKLLASGSVPEVIARAGLTTYFVEGDHLGGLADELRGKPGIDQVAAFGIALHVVGRDRAALEATLAPLRDRPELRVLEGKTSLEDVFIQFMAGSKDNMA